MQVILLESIMGPQSYIDIQPVENGCPRPHVYKRVPQPLPPYEAPEETFKLELVTETRKAYKFWCKVNGDLVYLLDDREDYS